MLKLKKRTSVQQTPIAIFFTFFIKNAFLVDSICLVNDTMVFSPAAIRRGINGKLP